MKNSLSAILFIFYLTLFLASCKKYNVPPQSELSKLPAATQIGANTFGCLINGQAFVPKNRSILEGPSLQCNYINLNKGYYLTVAGGNKNSDGSINSITIGTDSLSISEGQTIQLNDLRVEGRASASYFIINAPIYTYEYSTNAALTGKLSITKFDSVKQIVSGTFYFNVLNNKGDTIKITNGRFDMAYTR